MKCKLCPEDKPVVYIGETSRNLYTRSKEHLEKYVGGSKMEKSFIYKHQADIHDGTEAQFSAKVTGTFRDCLTRQLREGVFIRRSEVPVLN